MSQGNNQVNSIKINKLVLTESREKWSVLQNKVRRDRKGEWWAITVDERVVRTGFSRCSKSSKEPFRERVEQSGEVLRENSKLSSRKNSQFLAPSVSPSSHRTPVFVFVLFDLVSIMEQLQVMMSLIAPIAHSVSTNHFVTRYKWTWHRMARGVHSLLQPSAKSYKFDLEFLRKFSYLCRNYLSDQNGSFVDTFVLFLFLLSLSVLEQFIGYNIGMITSVYYRIMGNKDLNQFLVHTIKCIFVITAMSGVKSSKSYVSSSLQITWREKVTRKLHEVYFSNHLFYTVNVLPPSSSSEGRDNIDNPDQRITQDVNEFTKYLSSTIPSLLVAPFTIGWYSYKSYSTTGEFSRWCSKPGSDVIYFPGYIGPVGCFMFFLVTTVINKYLLSPIVNLVYHQERAEGHFRFQHVRIRSNAESIAFMSGGHLEKMISNHKLSELLGVQSRIMLKQLFLGLSVNFTDYIGSIISFVILAVPLFAGSFDGHSAPELSQLISANAFVSITLIYSFTNLIDLSSTFSIIAGNTHRIHQLVQELETLDDKELDEDTSDVRKDILGDSPEVFFHLTDVTISRPSTERSLNDQLIRGLTMKISSGTNVLISGPSGAGKTAIFRLLKGLWSQTLGTVERCDLSRVLFVPQKTLMTSSSLKQQLIYPKPVGDQVISEGDVLDLLKLFDLSHLLERVDGDWDKNVTWDWSDVLSPGELQRVSYVRVLYHRPKLVFLDEATSSVSEQVEALFYNQLIANNITFVTCSHQSSLIKYHELVLEIGDRTSAIKKL